MLKYPLSTLLYLAKINIKDKIQDILKLHNNIDVKLTVIVKDKDGKIIKVHKQRSHSFVSNFLSILASSLSASEAYNPGTAYGYWFRATTGTYVAYNPYGYLMDTIFDLNDSANDSTYGIVVGTGTSPPTPQDYQLGNQIVNGTGGGQLVYGAHTINPAPQTISGGNITTSSSTPSSGVLPVNGNTTSWQISRTFQNQSGASITVSEVGLYTKLASSGYYVMLAHDLLSSPISVPINAVLTIVYTISVST